MWIDEKIFFKVFKEHPDWFTNWVDEGNHIWNRVTGEIVYEDGTLMNDLVYRPPRDYNNYWKDCFNDEPKVYEGGSDTYKMTLSYDDYVKDPESFVTKAKDIDNQAYVNLDSLKSYKVTISAEDEEEDEQFTPDHDVWYTASLREDIDREEVNKFDKDYFKVDQVYFQKLGDGDCYNLVYHLSDGWVKIAEHCANYTICCDTFFEWFKIGKESVNQDIPIKEEEDFRDRRVSPSQLKINKTYEVRPYNRGGIHRDIRYICVNPYCPTVGFDDNYTDEWYAVWGGVTDQDISKKIYDNSTLEDCLDFIYNYFYVLERDNV